MAKTALLKVNFQTRAKRKLGSAVLLLGGSASARVPCGKGQGRKWGLDRESLIIVDDD